MARHAGPFIDLACFTEELAGLLAVTGLGILPLAVTSVSTPPPFSVLSETCTPALGPAASCEISVGFDPTISSSFNELLTIESADPASPTTIQLIGYGFDSNVIPIGGPLAWPVMFCLLAVAALWMLGRMQT